MEKIKLFKTISPDTISNSELHNYLLTAVAPRPIALVSTIDKEGNVNLSPFSYFNYFPSTPPMLVFSPTRKSSDKAVTDSYFNIAETSEVVINVVNHPIVEQMSLAAREYQKGVNEFLKSGLTEAPSSVVKPPRVLESPVSFECTVHQIIELGEIKGSGSLIVCKIEKIHIDEKYINPAGELDATKLNLVARIGGEWHSTATKESMFKINKTTQATGIGVDQLSRSIRNSNILDKNNLGRLGKADYLPTKEEIEDAMNQQAIKELFLEFETKRDMIKDGIHYLGKKMIEEGKTQKALATLMIVDQI